MVVSPTSTFCRAGTPWPSATMRVTQATMTKPRPHTGSTIETSSMARLTSQVATMSATMAIALAANTSTYIGSAQVAESLRLGLGHRDGASLGVLALVEQVHHAVVDALVEQDGRRVEATRLRIDVEADGPVDAGDVEL